MERLQKIIAQNHETISRRKAEELIEQGHVSLNGKTAQLGDKCLAGDEILIKGIPLKQKNKSEYYILNKPKGILTTKHDPKRRKTIYNLPSMKNLSHLNYAGRLDAMSEGLLILTTDGDLIQSLTHPSNQTKKVYHLRTEPVISKSDIEKLEKGLSIEGKKFYAKIQNKNNNEFDITIHEGRNRIIRRAMQKLNYKIFQLKRIQMGNIKLENLKPGKTKQISENEIKAK